MSQTPEFEPITVGIPEASSAVRSGMPRTVLALSLLAAVIPGGVAANAYGQGPKATQALDGKEFQQYPGDPSGLGYEGGVFDECRDNSGHNSYTVKKITPLTSDPAHKGRLSLDRLGIEGCDDYVDREIKKVVLMTRLVGQSKWKVGRISAPSVTSDSARSGVRLRPLDWGQTLRKGKTMQVKLRATTVVTNTTIGVPNMALGEKDEKTQVVLSKRFNVKR